MKIKLLWFIAGVVVCLMLCILVVRTNGSNIMFTVHESNFGFNETVSLIQKSAIENGWIVPKIYNIQATLKNAGHKDIAPVKVLSICQPDNTYRILRNDANKPISALMPCRVGVYQTADGRVFVSKLNIGLMSKLFGGNVKSVMEAVARQEEEILQGIVSEE